MRLLRGARPAAGCLNVVWYVQVRPLDPSQPTSVSLGSDGNSVRVVTSRGGGKPALFSFDKVFGGSATQASVYGEVSELVQSALDGYNVCLFSYGQTGAGKTHTMQGSQTPEGRGIIPRAVAQLLAAVKKLQAQGWEYSLEASYVEIYNEAIRDLLSPGSSQAPAAGLAIQHLSSGTALLGAERVLVTSVEEAEALVSRAGRARAVEATAMNATSSRSHSIFMLYCTGANSEAGVRLSGALNLVDLAGSERLNRSKVREPQAPWSKPSCFSCLLHSIEITAGSPTAGGGSPPERGLCDQQVAQCAWGCICLAGVEGPAHPLPQLQADASAAAVLGGGWQDPDVCEHQSRGGFCRRNTLLAQVCVPSMALIPR